MRDLLLIGFVLAGLLGASQVPGFVQEYEQRLGGARDETTRLLSEFSEIAKNSGETLAVYAARLVGNSDKSVSATGEEILGLARRQEALASHAKSLADSHRLMKPVVVATEGDHEIIAATWESFRYTLTIDPEFGGIGLFLGWLVHALISGIAGLMSPRPRVRHHRQGPYRRS